MRPLVRSGLVTFYTTHASIQMEGAARRLGVPGRLIPVPEAISAGCGYCWMAPLAARETVEQCLQQAQIPWQGIYEWEV
jgi:hypothetical protein